MSARARAPAKPSDPWSAWLAAYAPPPGLPDELLGDDGRLRPAWARFVEASGSALPAEPGRRLAPAGPSPLAELPILVSGPEWEAIAAGVEQRARLLEALLADLYGEARCVSEGVLPAAAVAGSPDYLRPLVGALPPGQPHLATYAADLGRGPDGRWWVLGDRTQAPSGAGFALENRLALSRALASLYRDLNVERLAPFFGALREGLASLSRRQEPRMAILTPGPYSETYREQATLARYLGLLLVEGDDLTVRDGRAHARTIGGLKRVDVLWRRVDGDFLDPLELDAASRLGVPGLLEAVRRGGVAVANAAGAGVAEARALLAFMPALARRYLAEDLILPAIATWWCGGEGERATVLERLDELAVESAHRQTLPGGAGRPGAELSAPERARLEAAIRRRGLDYVGQEVARLSTTPVLEGGRLVPRPFVLRVFAARTAEGWRVMPGGFGRVADRPDPRAISMREGARSADVWVLSEQPVPPVTLLPRAGDVRVRRVAGLLPSRAADHLYWLGRYLERAEMTLRVARLLLRADPETLFAETLPSQPSPSQTSPLPGAARPAEGLRQVLVAWGAASATPERPRALVAAQAIGDEDRPDSALACLRRAERAAASLSERLSPDMLVLLAELRATLASPGPDPAGAAEAALRALAGISGLAQENMSRVAAWRFLELGRRLERALATTRLARHFAGEGAGPGDLDALLDLVDCQITYRSRYVTGPALAPVRDLAVLDPTHPRSVAFQAAALDEHLASLPPLSEDGMPEPARRLARSLAASLATAQADDLEPPVLLGIEQELLALSDAIGRRYFPFGADAARPERLNRLG